MQILIKGAKVVDPGNLEDHRDILIQDGKFEKILEPGESINTEDVQVVDAEG